MEEAPCERNVIYLNFNFATDFLWWQPGRITNYNLSVDNTEFDLSRVDETNSDWQPGLRFEMSLIDSNSKCFALLAYTYLERVGNYFEGNGKYLTFETLFGKRFSFGNQQTLVPFIGVQSLQESAILLKFSKAVSPFHLAMSS